MLKNDGVGGGMKGKKEEDGQGNEARRAGGEEEGKDGDRL